jgi:succinoglycan biosynthesis transport protein ExoP
VARGSRSQVMAISPQVARLASQASRAAGNATDLGGLFQVLKRNFWKIALATLASLLLAVTYLALAKPLYTTTASLFVDPRTRKVVSEEVVQGGFGSDLALIESQVSIITSDAVLGRVVDKLNLTTDPEYAPPMGQGMTAQLKALLGRASPPPDPKGQALATLAQSIKVRRAQKTYVVDVDVTASNPVKVARVAQALVDAYLADQTAAKTAEAKRANALIDARLGELREQVRKAETRLDDFKKSNKILTAEGGIVTEQQLTRLSGELINTRAVAAEAKARQDQIQQVLKSGAGPDVLPDAIRSGLVQRLREQYAQVARREASLSAQLQPRHPVLIDVRSQLNEVKAQINAELKRIATASQAEYQIATNREKEISSQLEKSKDDVIRTNTAQIKVRELEQEATASRELLRLFLARAKETQEQQNTSTPDARIITPPGIPAKPSKPIPWLILSLGLLGGLGLGLASALITDHFDTSLRSIADLTREAGIGTSTSIPTLTGGSIFSRLREEPVNEHPQAAQFSDLLSAVADTKGRREIAYRQAVLRLLAKIKSHQRPGRPHTVMFVSPTAGAGNSATTLAVAYAAALAGERVLLVDATSTNPELSTIFATSLAPTNVVILDNKEHLNRITTRDSRSGLAFLPIALADLRSLKTQQRRRLIAGLNGLSQNYDLIFIDAGGLLEDESTLSLIPAADQILVVCRAGLTSRSDLAETLEILESAHDQISGAVLTMTSSETA